MSVDTEVLSTTDMRLWVEGMTADKEEIPCALILEGPNPNPCPNQAVVLLIFDCGCDLPACLSHRDLILAGADKHPWALGKAGCHWRCAKHKQQIEVVRVEPIK